MAHVVASNLVQLSVVYISTEKNQTVNLLPVRDPAKQQSVPPIDLCTLLAERVDPKKNREQGRGRPVHLSKRRTLMFSPSCAMVSFTTDCTFLELSLMYGWSINDMRILLLAMRPSTIMALQVRVGVWAWSDRRCSELPTHLLFL